MGSKNERDDNMRKYREEKEQLEQKIARGEISPKELVACNSIKSDYDLSPRQAWVVATSDHKGRCVLTN
jgi:hypothetical protein